jgi:hypothetical protein
LWLHPYAEAKVAIAPVSAAEAPARPPELADPVEATVFQRGNLHTHTRFSDGDSPPEDVYLWYRRRGYAFVAVTDHNTLTAPATYRELERAGFDLVAGEELSTTAGELRRPVHVNGLCTKRTIGGGHFADATQALSWAVRAIHDQGGVALVNHPNFEWALTEGDVYFAERAELLEIWSGHGGVRAGGDAEHPSAEALWDRLLTAGYPIYGVAVDDAHHLGPPPRDVPHVPPGRAWVEVFAESPDPARICEALRAGHLYASSGARLERVAVTKESYSVRPAEVGARVELVGKGGEVLSTAETTAESPEVVYRVRGDEGYVRARVTDSRGRAWTQPHRVLR